MKTRSMRNVLLAGLALAASMPVWTFGQDGAAAKKQESAPKGLRIFVCGHSLHWYIPTPLAEMAKAAGIQGHELVGQQSLGVSKTQQHWDLPEGQNKAKEALRKGNVDVFTMSPIQFPDEGITDFVNLGLEHNPNMRFTVQISWSRADLDPLSIPKNVPATADRNKTPEQLRKTFEGNIKLAEAQADEINKKAGKKVLFLVPSVQASIAMREKIYKKDLPGLATQGELFKDTMSHPTAPLEVVNAYLHFAVIYGQSPVGLTMPNYLKSAQNAGWDEKFDRTLQELSWNVVSNYPYSGVTAAKSN